MSKEFLILLSVLLVSCADADSDGIYDKNDDCPNEYGYAEFNGCPDSDEDGIQDSEDECPNVHGTAEFDGCPDSDEDGIQDSEDECPNVHGTAEFDGCPDSDEDGIQDSEDDCPYEYGYPQFNGCPNAGKIKMLASDCFKALALSEREINDYVKNFNTARSSIIYYGECEIIKEYILNVRKLEREYNQSITSLEQDFDQFEKMLDEGYIQTVRSTTIKGNIRLSQYLIVKKKGVFYLMEVLSGGDCSMGTMVFNEKTVEPQEVWVRESPFEEKYKGFVMQLIKKSRDYSLLDRELSGIGL